MVPGLAQEQTLKNELRNFKAKITLAGNEMFEAWRDSDTDDLVLSVALACWLGEKTFPRWDGTVHSDARDGRPGSYLVSQLPPGVFLDDQWPRNDPRFHGGRDPNPGSISFPNW
jgi:hypothetical protein